MSETLNSLMAAQHELLEALVASDGELSAEMESKLAQLEVSVPAKLDSYYLIMERLDSEAAYFKSRAEEFAMAAKQMGSAKERLKDNLKFHMQSNALKELAGVDYKFTLSNSKPSVLIHNEELIPKEYCKEVVMVKIDKDKIREDLSLGVPVAGASLVEGVSLRSSINKSNKKIKAGA